MPFEKHFDNLVLAVNDKKDDRNEYFITFFYFESYEIRIENNENLKTVITVIVVLRRQKKTFNVCIQTNKMFLLFFIKINFH